MEACKRFFKPTVAKAIVFAALMASLNYLAISTFHILDARALVGVPLGFYPVGGFMIWPNHPLPPTVEFSWTNLIIDIAFWYFVACGVVALCLKARFHLRPQRDSWTSPFALQTNRMA